MSHPADTIVSYMNKAKGATIGSAAKDLGFKGMWGGLGPRIIMIGTLTALQWFIYDSVKVRIANLSQIRMIEVCSNSILYAQNLSENFTLIDILTGRIQITSSTSTTNARIP